MELKSSVEFEEASFRDEEGKLVATVKKDMGKEELLMALASIHDLTHPEKRTTGENVEFVVQNCKEIYGYANLNGRIKLVTFNASSVIGGSGYVFLDVEGTASANERYTLIRVGELGDF